MQPLAPAVAALGALALAGSVSGVACGGRQASGDGARVSVEMSEWSIQVSNRAVTSGPMALALKNRGRLGHELVIIKTDQPPAALAAHEGFVDEAAAGEVVGRIGLLPPGREQTQTFQLNPGKYVLICNVVGHYQLGMAAALEAR